MKITALVRGLCAACLLIVVSGCATQREVPVVERYTISLPEYASGFQPVVCRESVGRFGITQKSSCFDGSHRPENQSFYCGMPSSSFSMESGRSNMRHGGNHDGPRFEHRASSESHNNHNNHEMHRYAQSVRTMMPSRNDSRCSESRYSPPTSRATDNARNDSHSAPSIPDHSSSHHGPR